MMERYGLFFILISGFCACCSLGFTETLPKDSNDLGLFALTFEEAMDILSETAEELGIALKGAEDE